jgi:hypothetical protein
MMRRLPLALIVFATALPSCAQPPAGEAPPPPLDWKALEPPLLTHHIQLTSRDRFVKAGEAYFSPDASWIIFQAVPVPAAGQEPDPFYSMYCAKLTRDADGNLTGTGDPILLSNPGSANTCGWFHPTEPWRVIFGSTITRPATDQHAGFQVGTRKYVWLFPQETDVVTRVVPQIYADLNPGKEPQWSPNDLKTVPVFSRPEYDAECSYSKDGRFLLYAHVREDKKTGGRADADIWVYDTKTKEQHALVTADGYDGGPFFSPDGKRICYRSDRKLNDLLQLFIADLKFDAQGVPVGIEREYQLTDNDSVNWAPYFHPSGTFLIYGTSQISHANYEVFAIELDEARLKAPHPSLRQARITQANGADVLPVFSPDGQWMMWTAQRGPMAPGETKPSSQLWAARFDAAAIKWAAQP